MRQIYLKAGLLLFLAVVPTNYVRADPVEEDHFATFTEGNNEYIRQVAEGDIEGLMKHYAEGAIQIPPGAPSIIGRENIRQSWETYFAEFEVIEAESFIDGVVVTGDRAFAYGHYSQTSRSKSDGATYRESGRFAESDRRLEDGTWVMEVEIWNFDKPALKLD